MDKILFLNACIRPCSRTLELAETLLQKLNGDVQEMRLYEMSLPALDLTGMGKRDQAVQKTDFSDPAFDAAKQFAAADVKKQSKAQCAYCRHYNLQKCCHGIHHTPTPNTVLASK